MHSIPTEENEGLRIDAVASSKRIKVISAVATLLSVACCFFFSKIASTEIDPKHIDGAFQTASGLFRLATGALPGRDFLPYLGTGPLFIIYPFFVLFGETLQASNFSAQLVTILLFYLIIFTITFLIVKKNRVTHSLLIASLLINLLMAANSLGWISFGNPGNSLRLIRSAIPYLLAIPFLLIAASNLSAVNKQRVLASLIGTAILWSNDYSLTTSLTFTLLLIYWLHSQKQLKPASILRVALWGGFSALLTLTLACGGKPLDLLIYNFSDVRQDQYWYFGEWGPAHKIFNISDFFIKNGLGIGPLLGVWFFVLGMAIKNRRLEDALLLCIGSALMLSGIIASTLGHIDKYYNAFHLWAFLIIVASCIHTILNRGFKEKLFQQILVSGTAGSLLLSGIVSFDAYKSKRLETATGYLFYEQLGATTAIKASHGPYLDRILQYKDADVIEEYWGLYGAMTGKHSHLPVDSAIHALGTERDRFEKEIKRLPQVVITTHPMPALHWQTWMVSANFWFYETLFRHYHVVFESPTVLWWERHNKPADWVEFPVQVIGDEFLIKGAHPGHYKVLLSISVEGGKPSLILIDNKIINWAPLSLNPSKQNMLTFPVYVSGKEASARFKIQTEPRYKALKTKILKARAWSMPPQDEALPPQN